MEKQKRRDGYGIVEGVIWQQLLIFFFPILLGTFFQQLYNTADAMIVGKYVGKQALAAVGGSTGNLINLIVGFFVGLSSGATVIISQFYGARQNDQVSRTVHTALALAITGGLLLTVCRLLRIERRLVPGELSLRSHLNAPGFLLHYLDGEPIDVGMHLERAHEGEERFLLSRKAVRAVMVNRLRIITPVL